MEPFYQIIRKQKKCGVGLISGTSADGIDAAVLSLTGSGSALNMDLLHFESYPYPAELKKEILNISTLERVHFEQYCRLDFLLGEIFAKSALAVIKAAGLAPAEVDFIGSHGQTVRHLPRPVERFGFAVTATRQIAEPAIIAKRTGIMTVADFRPADMAAGGQGAPLVSYFDFICFHSEKTSRALLNIGGIANMTIIPQGANLEDVTAFDTGPGNMVIDYLMHKLFSQAYDENGATAASGTISPDLLKYGLNHPYFDRKPPKSTGREEFGGDFAENLLQQATTLRLKPEDTIATATELSAKTIVAAYKTFVAKKTRVDEIIVSGGGVQNGFLMNRLKINADGIKISTTDDYGVPSDAKEAMCFALMAYETLCGHPTNLPGVTGASEPVIMGKICP